MADETKFTTAHSARRPWRLLVLVAVLSAICSGVTSFGVGCVIGYMSNGVERGDRNVGRVERIFAANPAKFGSLTINRGPLDKFRLEGTVNTQADLDFLRDELLRDFGENQVDEMLFVFVNGDQPQSVLPEY